MTSLFLYNYIEWFLKDVAAACIFLATKTEECGRKLRDVAKVMRAKISKTDPKDIADFDKVVLGINSIVCRH